MPVNGRWHLVRRLKGSELGWAGMHWIDLAQDKGRWLDFVNAVKNLWVP